MRKHATQGPVHVHAFNQALGGSAHPVQLTVKLIYITVTTYSHLLVHDTVHQLGGCCAGCICIH